MLIIKDEKKKNKGRNRTGKSRMNQNVEREKNHKYLGLLEADIIKQTDLKKKKKKISNKRGNSSKLRSEAEISSKG